MAVNWYWKHKLGEVHYYDTEHKQHWKLDMYGGNMMCCFIYHFVNEQNEKMYNFFGFFNDIEHAKRVLKSDNKYFHSLTMGNHVFRKIRLHVTSKEYKYSNKEMLQFGKLMAEYGYKVELY